MLVGKLMALRYIASKVFLVDTILDDSNELPRVVGSRITHDVLDSRLDVHVSDSNLVSNLSDSNPYSGVELRH